MVALEVRLPETNIEDTLELSESFDWVIETVNEMICFSH